MSDIFDFTLPENPGSTHPPLAVVQDYDGEADRHRKYGDVLEEYENKVDAYNEWAETNSPESYLELVTSIRKAIPAKGSPVMGEPTSFIASLLAIATLIIHTLNGLIPGVEFSLVRRMTDSEDQMPGIQPFSHRYRKSPGKQYDTLRHSSTWGYGVALVKSIGLSSDDRCVLYDSTGESAYWVPQDMIGSLDGKILELVGDILPGKKYRKSIPHDIFPTITWIRTNPQGVHAKRAVLAFVDQSVHTRFHEQRKAVYNERIRNEWDTLKAGDYAESQTEKIMESLDLL